MINQRALEKISNLKSIVFAYVILALGLLFCLKINCVNAAIYYVDATLGNDNSNGLSPNKAWKTLYKVNNSIFQPGDSILFKRGEVWKNNTGKFCPTGHFAAVFPVSGKEDNYIIYGAYGEGAKPKITLFREKNNNTDWKNEGNNIWSTGNVLPFGAELLPNPSFNITTHNWSVYFNSSSGAAGSMCKTTLLSEFDSKPGGVKITVNNSGNRSSDVQVYTYNMSIKYGKYYKLTFRAKASSKFTISSPPLHKATSPYTIYYFNKNASILINTDWKTYTIYYAANITSEDARITFYLGNAIPDGTIFYLDSLSLKEVDGNVLLITDIANIIMDNKTKFGTKKWGSNASSKRWTDAERLYWTTLSSQGDFYYDIGNKLLKMYSTQNPAIYYNGNIKLILRGSDFIFTGKSYIIVDGLHLSMAGTYGAGIVGNNPHHIIIRNCDISYIGGADQKMNGTDPIRNGNAIGIENSAHDITFEKNRIWEIYDAAISPQSYRKSIIYNIVVRNNIIWNSEYGIEYWQRPETTQAYNIYFDNNTIVDSGYGWSHNQRDTKNGRGLMIFINNAVQSNITFRNNIFYNATEGLVRVSRRDGLANLNISNNYYYNSSGSLAKITYYPTYTTSKVFSLNNLADWKNTTGKDQNSIVGQKDVFENKSIHNYNLIGTSSAIDAGIESIASTDFFGNPVYGIPDIGAIEYQPPYTMDVDKVKVESIRVYGDGKYRNLSSNSILPIDFTVIPQVSNIKQWIDIADIAWGESKQWTENSDNLICSTNHVIGGLQPNKSYHVLVDNVLGKNITGCNNGICTSDSFGKIYFVYTGRYSNVKFTIK